MTSSTDFTVIYYGAGSIVLVRAENVQARDHLEDNVQLGAVWISHCLAVEKRYLADLVDGLRANGFSVGVAR